MTLTARNAASTREVAPAEVALREAGLRVTQTRRAVYHALHDTPHASADDVFLRIAERLPRTSRQSVYNALGDFVDVGIVRRIEPAGRAMLFELRVHDNHHHLVCSVCGAVEDVDCVVGHAPCLTPADAHGYAVQTAEVTFWGVCPRCTADRQ